MLDLSPIRLFAFDFDGTLVQSNAIKRSTFYEVVNGVPSAEAALDRLFATHPQLDRYGIFAALAEQVAGVDAHSLAEAYTRRCEARILAAPEVPGAAKLLEALKQRRRRVVVNSSTPQAPLCRLLPQLALGKHVDAIYGEPASKADNLVAAMQEIGADRGEAVVIGDGESDRRAAAHIGCAFIAVRSDGNNFAEPPPCTVNRLDDLIGWL